MISNTTKYFPFWLAIYGAAVCAGPAAAQEIDVAVDNFVRAASDIEFGKYVDLVGGVNEFNHMREPTAIDTQPTIRMNRDTLYSQAVIDISEGARLVLPETGDRYISAQIVNQDHFMDEVFIGGGSYTLDMETFETPYVLAIIRTLVDASDPEDVDEVHSLQDQMRIEAASSNPFIVPDYNRERFDGVLKAVIELGRFVPDSARTFGRKGEVDPVRYMVGAAIGWGGLPDDQAMYINVEPGLPVGTYKIEVPTDVPAEEFWSVSLYNADGFFEQNAQDAYSVNSVTGTPNDDGSMTVHLGGCDEDRVNCLPIMDGWNYIVRLYRPGTAAVDGSWSFPAVEEAD
ncbi:DUF1254 domain-containing protein [Tropicimonas sp. TH_r6]|uniref:DUF1214 domain-containing protein n=1 Tax=Tropicimonas sp. TH_r6 TaxID=3082085 RepID=UPI002954F43B|nr:DUF1214 domain-containing protein [Tropicimonas sp. TH_r6]MDV7145806.1 DUF1254 domain-containing protein [Tropicimonas sp. TH_r6]